VHDKELAENRLRSAVVFSGILKLLVDPVSSRGRDVPRVAFSKV